MRKEKLELEKREYLQPSITMYGVTEESYLLAGSVDDAQNMEQWGEENLEEERGDDLFE